MPDNAAQTDNVAQITIPNKLTDEGVITTFYIDKKVVAALKRMAIRDNCSVSSLANEALATWVKWLAKASMEEMETEENRDVLAAEYLAMREIWKGIRIRKAQWMARKRKESNESRAMGDRKYWHKLHPGKPWPGVDK